MPTACKIFLYRENLSLEEIEKQLEGHIITELFEEGSIELELITDIINLKLGEEELSGLFRYDGIVHQSHRSGMQIYPKTTNAPFIFAKHEESVFLIVLAKKVVSNNVANALSKILHSELGAITEPVIPANALEEFYRAGEATKVLFLEDIPIPNMNKLTLYGENVVQTDIHGQFVKQGSPHYVVFKTQDGWTVGVVDNGSVTMFSMVDVSTFERFIKDRIFPLILGRR